MGIFNTLANQVKAAIGYQQDFESLMESNNVSRALSMMTDYSTEAIKYLADYDVDQHKINLRKDKAVYDKKGNFLRWSKRNKIAMPYQEFINEVALVFLYGRPVKWTDLTDGTDEAFGKYTELMTDIRFDSAVKECKRKAGAEGSAAILYHVYKDDDGNPKLRLKVLAKSTNDDIYAIKDQYGRMKAFAWSYYVKEAGAHTVQHIEVYTKKTIYYCKRAQIGWEVKKYDNAIGKIPVLLFEQRPESASVQCIIDRLELMESVDADTVDRFSNPALVATADILNSLPKEEEEAKLFILKNGGELRYLTWDQSSASKEAEYTRLESKVLKLSFTPDIDLDKLKTLGNLSAKAILKVMLIGVIKADRHKESHDGYMNRHAHLMLAILGNVLDYRHKSVYDSMKIGHEFQDPFGDDVSEKLADALKQFSAGALSLQSVLELSYLVKSAKVEYERIKDEQDEADERQAKLQQQSNINDIFGQGE